MGSTAENKVIGFPSSFFSDKPVTRNENQRQIYLFLLFCELQILKNDEPWCNNVISAHLFICSLYNLGSCICFPLALGQRVIMEACRRPPKNCLVIGFFCFVCLLNEAAPGPQPGRAVGQTPHQGTWQARSLWLRANLAIQEKALEPIIFAQLSFFMRKHASFHLLQEPEKYINVQGQRFSWRVGASGGILLGEAEWQRAARSLHQTITAKPAKIPAEVRKPGEILSPCRYPKVKPKAGSNRGW